VFCGRYLSLKGFASFYMDIDLSEMDWFYIRIAYFMEPRLVCTVWLCY
jgi:hypothetical protein